MTYDLGVFKRQRYVYPTFNAVGGNISYYTSNGVAYTVHTFLSGTSTFAVFSTSTVDILLVGAGASGTSNGPGGQYGAGGNAGQVLTTSTTLNIGQCIVTVGQGGAGNQTGSFAAGGNTSIVGTINILIASTATGATSGGGADGAGGGLGASGTRNVNSGGPGVANNYATTVSTYYGGGGGAYTAGYGAGNGSGGIGGGGGAGVSATPNTGGGGGGSGDGYSSGGSYYPSGSGGSGIVVIRYPTPINSIIPVNDQYFNYVSLLLSNQTTNVTTPQGISSTVIPKIEYIAVGGGGASGRETGGYPQNYHLGGGGGGGGVVFGTFTNVLLASSNTFVVTIGGGGTTGGSGGSTTVTSRAGWGFSTATIAALGGGAGGNGSSGNTSDATAGTAGGSGGGGGGGYGGGGGGGTSTQITIVDVSRGYSGGAGGARGASFNWAFGGGGGGAGGAGQAGAQDAGGAGGSGYTWLNGSAYGAGGDGHPAGASTSGSGVAGAAGTGNGGTADGSQVNGSPGNQPYGPGGGSGAVIFRYAGTQVLATGGAISTVSNYVYHSFTSGGVLSLIDTISTSTTVTLSSPINYLLVGGGGGGAGSTFSGTPGAGGAGGLITGTFTITNIATLLSISIGSGGGGGGSGAGGNIGNDSSITGNYITKIAYGGGAGGGGAGGSGGGATGFNPGTSGAGAATQPGSIYGGYGNAGSTSNSGGGGGAGATGSGTAGGLGLYVNTPSSTYAKTYATGGTGGAGDGGINSTPNTGNGGGSAGSGSSNSAGGGGSGISILWEPSSNPMPSVIGAPTIVTTSGYRVYVFTSTGALIFGNSLSNTKFTDNGTNSYPILYNGNPSQGSFNPYAKNWSVYFDGSSYLSIPNSASYGTTRLNLGSNSDFTIEGWAYFNSVSSGMLIAHEYTIWRIGVASGTLQYSLSSNGSNYAGIASSVSMGTVVVGRWYHFALVRNGSTFTPYLNGIAGTPTISSASLYGGTIEGLTVGMGDTNNYFSGYLSNIRILKGTAFYTAPFTPSISPLPLVANTLLLTCSNSIWDDVSDYNWSIIPKGIPAVKKFSPFSNFGSYNTTLVGGSAYFNGTTDYLTVSSTSTTNVPDWTYLHNGTTDYTIEGWIYPFSTSTQQGLISTGGSVTVPGMSLFYSYFYAGKGSLTWEITKGDNSSYTQISSNASIVKENAWSHIACTFASSNKTTSLYVNGVRVATSATTTSSFTATSTAYPLAIGNFGAITGYYKGYISNLRILKGVISDGVVTSNIPVGTTLEYLVVGGGGGAGTGGGGGAGGFRTSTFVTTQTGIIYTVTVGNGGAAGGAGGDSSLVGGSLNFVSAGGGGGGGTGGNGGSGGGGGGSGTGGFGNTPATVPAQGFNGGTGSGGNGNGGGGGATSAGTVRNGGAGALSNIDGLGYYYSGGGGGNGGGYTGGDGGIGGGGYGQGYNFGNQGSGSRGTASSTSGFSNSGGGGGTNGAGGSGIVIIRYLGPQRATGGNIITTNISGYTVHTFLSSGVFTDSIPSYTLPVAPVVASSTATNLLLNFTDSVIVDASSNTDIYTGGDAGLISPIKKYNNMSMYFDGTTGTGLIISTSSAVALGSGDFTVEMWMYPLTSYNTGNAPALLDARTTGDGAGLIRFGFNGTTIYGGPQIAWKENVTSIVTATVILNVWQHIAVVRNSGTITMYNNGTAISNASNSTSLTVPFKYIAQTYNNLPFNGYIDDLRITNGIARYTTAFIPPIQKLQLK